ncbi:MAG: xanthine dehydrogenase family protein subunit M [Gammaproteobacteria bacterium]
MFPAHIDEYLRPATIAEALAANARYDEGEAMFIAGGQSLMQAIKSRMARPRCLIDLQAIDALKGIDFSAGLRIGAMTRYVEIAADERLRGAWSALRDAAGHVGDRQVRNRGTIGGSCCWNYLASCTPAVVLGLGGTMHLVAADGTRRALPAEEFLIGPLETARRADEMLEAVAFAASAGRGGSAYRKWGLVKDALPVVGICVSVQLDASGGCTSARIALSGLAAGAQLAPAGAAVLVGSRGEAATIARAMDAVAAAVEAQSDKWASTDYRQQLIRTLGAEVAATAFARAAA